MASDGLRHFWLLLWNCWTAFNETRQEARSQRPLLNLCFFGPIGMAETFSTSPQKPKNEIQRIMTGSNISTSSTKFVILKSKSKFRADRKYKMADLASDLLRHFRLLLWNFWKEYSETWQEATCQRPLLSLCFSDRSEKQDGRPGCWYAETFSTSPLKPLNGIQRNWTGNKILASSTKFVFFLADQSTKMAALADSPERWHIVFRCTICGPFASFLI